MSNRPLLPGAGFWVLMLTLAAFVGLFAWGASESDLDVVREVQLRWTAGKNVPMTHSEEDALEDVVASFPAFAESVANGRNAALLEESEMGCLRFPETHLLVPKQEAGAVLDLTCLPGAGGTELRLEGPFEPLVVNCPEKGGVVDVALPAMNKARVVNVARPGETAWAGDGCPIRLNGRLEVAP